MFSSFIFAKTIDDILVADKNKLKYDDYQSVILNVMLKHMSTHRQDIQIEGVLQYKVHWILSTFNLLDMMKNWNKHPCFS